MRNKITSVPVFRPGSGLILLLACLLNGGLNSVAAAEILTLFTTPDERQIINNNRYKSNEIQVEKPVDSALEAPVQRQQMEQVIHSYRVNGITISNGGSHSVWINDSIYVDGDQLSDNSKIKVLHDGEIKVRITAPDGKHYFAKSGETVEAAYLVPVPE